MLKLPLSYLYRPAANGAAEPWLVVLMHGVGSNEADLFGLAEYMPPQCHVLSLRAPIAMGPQNYAWFQFGVTPDGGRVIEEAQERAARALVEQACVAAAAQLGVPASRTVLGGFSQGGIMSLSMLLTRPELMRAVMVWHSRLLPEVLPLQAPNAALEGRSAWVSHGTIDDVIPLVNAHTIRTHLEKTPVDLTYREYPCRHELHPQELQDSLAWLKNLMAAA